MNVNFFPWYNNIERQNRNLHQVNGDISSFKLYCSTSLLLPFQFRVQSNSKEISSCLLYNVDGKEIGDLVNYGPSNQFKRLSFDGFDVIYYDAKTPFLKKINPGIYYCKMTNGVDTWYSEVFEVVSDNELSKFIEITTYCDNDLEDIIFQDGFVFKLYLDTDIGTPAYEYLEDGLKKDGIFLPVKQLIRKEYKLTTYVPEFLCDTLNAMRVNDNIVFTSPVYGSLNAIEISIENPKWQNDGGFALLDISFKTDWQLKKTSLSVNNQKRVRVFNNDFNNDFKKN